MTVIWSSHHDASPGWSSISTWFWQDTQAVGGRSGGSLSTIVSARALPRLIGPCKFAKSTSFWGKSHTRMIYKTISNSQSLERPSFENCVFINLTACLQILSCLSLTDMISRRVTTSLWSRSKISYREQQLPYCQARLWWISCLSVRLFAMDNPIWPIWLFDAVKNFPAWLPGMSFKRDALNHIGEMIHCVEAPFSFTKGEIVCLSYMCFERSKLIYKQLVLR